jgi:hypothetical protein
MTKQEAQIHAQKIVAIFGKGWKPRLRKDTQQWGCEVRNGLIDVCAFSNGDKIIYQAWFNGCNQLIAKECGTPHAALSNLVGMLKIRQKQLTKAINAVPLHIGVER